MQRVLWGVLCAAALFGCDGSTVVSGAQGGGPDVMDPGDASLLTAAELAALGALSPLPALPPDPTNRYADVPQAAQLGQKLFFDKSYSGALAVADDGTNGGLGSVGETGKVSCASCHAPGSQALNDRRSVPGNVSLGTDYGTRVALGIVNSSFYKWTNWGGRFDSQWSLPLAVAENPKIMNGTRLQLAHMLYAKYRAEYNATFPVALDPALDPKATDAARFKAVLYTAADLVQLLLDDTDLVPLIKHLGPLFDVDPAQGGAIDGLAAVLRRGIPTDKGQVMITLGRNFLRADASGRYPASYLGDSIAEINRARAGAPGVRGTDFDEADHAAALSTLGKALLDDQRGVRRILDVIAASKASAGE